MRQIGHVTSGKNKTLILHPISTGPLSPQMPELCWAFGNSIEAPLKPRY
jgi:hypothetical protein